MDAGRWIGVGGERGMGNTGDRRGWSSCPPSTVLSTCPLGCQTTVAPWEHACLQDSQTRKKFQPCVCWFSTEMCLMHCYSDVSSRRQKPTTVTEVARSRTHVFLVEVFRIAWVLLYARYLLIWHRINWAIHLMTNDTDEFWSSSKSGVHKSRAPARPDD
jgi:hypothetical protein